MKHLYLYLTVSTFIFFSSCIGDCSDFIRCYVEQDVTLHFKGYTKNDIDSVVVQLFTPNYASTSDAGRRYDSLALARLNVHSHPDSLSIRGLGITNENAIVHDINIIVYPGKRIYKFRNLTYDKNERQYETRKCNQNAKGCERKLVSFVLDSVVYTAPNVHTAVLAR